MDEIITESTSTEMAMCFIIRKQISTKGLFNELWDIITLILLFVSGKRLPSSRYQNLNKTVICSNMLKDPEWMVNLKTLWLWNSGLIPLFKITIWERAEIHFATAVYFVIYFCFGPRIHQNSIFYIIFEWAKAPSVWTMGHQKVSSGSTSGTVSLELRKLSVFAAVLDLVQILIVCLININTCWI